ncbi:hypothetical protein Goshw_008381, partial [Gossypium schwendimanii]|nr:hypothetical protein [Gossypium schwendimanii]
PLYKLKVLNLKGSDNLIKALDFTTSPNLEILVLEGCTRLVAKSFLEIDGKMECLLMLYLDGTSIEQLPSSIGNLSNLVLLNLKDCRNLQLEFLEELDLSKTTIRKPPSFISQLKNLKDLSSVGARDLHLSLGSLKELNLRDYNLFDIPNDICCLYSLKELDLSSNNFISILSSLTRLSKL